MNTLENIQDNFFDEANELCWYLDYIEANFYSNTEFAADVLEEDDYKQVKALVKGLKIDSDDPNDEKNNQAIINSILKKIDTQINKNQGIINNRPKKRIPDELSNSAIVKDHPELLEYLMDTDLSLYSPDDLKEEIDSVPDGEPYYGTLTVDDYSILLQYAELYFFNEETESIIYRNRYLRSKKIIFSTMKSECKTNIYRQVFILLLALFDSTLTDYFIYLLNNSFFKLYNTQRLIKTIKIKICHSLQQWKNLKKK